MVSDEKGDGVYGEIKRQDALAERGIYVSFQSLRLVGNTDLLFSGTLFYILVEA